MDIEKEYLDLSAKLSKMFKESNVDSFVLLTNGKENMLHCEGDMINIVDKLVIAMGKDPMFEKIIKAAVKYHQIAQERQATSNLINDALKNTN